MIAKGLRTAHFLLAGLVTFFCHLPLIFLILGLRQTRNVVIFAVLLLTIPLLMEKLRLSGRDRLRKWLSVFYYSLVGAYFLVLLYVIGPLGPPVFAGMGLYALIVGLAVKLLNRRPRLLAFCLALSALPMMVHLGNLVHLYALALIFVFLLYVSLPRLPDRAGIGALPLALMVFSILVHTEAFTFYKGISLFDRLLQPDPKIVKTIPPGDEPVTLPKLAVPTGLNRFGKPLFETTDYRFAYQGCQHDSYLVGTRQLFGLKLFYTGQAHGFGPSFFDVGDNIVLDCTKDLLLSGDYGGSQVTRYDPQTLTPRQSWKMPSAHPTFLELDGQAGLLYVATDFDGSLYVLELSTGRIIRRLTVPGGLAHFALDSEHRKVFAIGGNANLYTLEAPDWQPVLRIKFPGMLISQVVYDQGRQRLYLSNFLTGFVQAIDTDTFEVIKRRWLGASIRFLLLLPGRELAAAGYFSGKIYLLDKETLEVKNSIYAGKRIRWMTLDRLGENILTTSTYGPISIDISANRGARQDD